MICKKCGNEITDDSMFCQECGTPIEQKKLCSKCGNELGEGAVFCQKCGTPVEAEEQVASNKKFCANCGAEMDEDAVFCRSCGTAVEKKKTMSKGKKTAIIITTAVMVVFAAVFTVVYNVINTPDKRIMKALDNTINAESFRVELESDNIFSKDYYIISKENENTDYNYYDDMTIEIIGKNGSNEDMMIYYSVADFEENLITSERRYNKYYLANQVYHFKLFNDDGSYIYLSDLPKPDYRYDVKYDIFYTEDSDKNMIYNVNDQNIKELTNRTKLSNWLDSNLDMNMNDCKELLPQILKDMCKFGSKPDYIKEYERDKKDNSYKFTLDIEKFVKALSSDYGVNVSDKLSDKVSNTDYELELKISLTKNNSYISSVEFELSGCKKTRTLSAKFDKINATAELRQIREDMKEETVIGFINTVSRSMDMPAYRPSWTFRDEIYNDVRDGKIVSMKGVKYTVTVPTSEPVKSDDKTDTEYELEKILYQYYTIKPSSIPKGTVTFEPRFYDPEKEDWVATEPDDLKSYICENNLAIFFAAVEWSE